MPTELTLTTPDIIVCGVTLVGSMLAGLWLGMRKTAAGSSDGFFLASRRLTWPVVKLVTVGGNENRGLGYESVLDSQ